MQLAVDLLLALDLMRISRTARCRLQQIHDKWKLMESDTIAAIELYKRLMTASAGGHSV